MIMRTKFIILNMGTKNKKYKRNIASEFMKNKNRVPVF